MATSGINPFCNVIYEMKIKHGMKRIKRVLYSQRNQFRFERAKSIKTRKSFSISTTYFTRKIDKFIHSKVFNQNFYQYFTNEAH